MSTEYEIKILGIDPDKITQTIMKKGGIHIADLYFRRYIFEIPGGQKSEWLRLRTDGTKATLTYKNAAKDTIDGVEEIEVNVDSFEATYKLLIKSGLSEASYQENKRVLYKIGAVELAIDEWPMIPKYLEIEAPDKTSVEEMIRRLSLNGFEKTSLPTNAVYKKHGLNLEDYKSLKFEKSY